MKFCIALANYGLISNYDKEDLEFTSFVSNPSPANQSLSLLLNLCIPKLDLSKISINNQSSL